jgi:protein phosphatase
MTTPTETLRAVASLLSDPGCRRDLNEDSGVCVVPHDAAVLQSKGVLVVVADGMGGHAAGEVASRLAVETVRAAYYAAVADPGVALLDAFAIANRAIHDAATGDERHRGMGTTCTALALHGDQASCAHVGDSRLYMLRGSSLYAMTEDHSAVRDMVNRGMISAAEARRHEDRNVLLRALGTHSRVDVASWGRPLPVRRGDCFVLCSDGLHDLVEAEELRAAAARLAPADACAHLVRLARARGGYDNITVAVVRLEEARSTGGTAPQTRAVRTAP